MINLEKLTCEKEFNELLRFSLEDYANNIFQHDESENYEKAYQYAHNEVMPNIPEGLKTPAHYVYKIMDESKTLGYFWFQMMNNMRTGFVVYIYIHPEYRHQGFAKQAIQLYEKKLRIINARDSILYVFKQNIDAIGLYQRCGYTVANECTCYDGEKPTRYKMQKPLIL